MTWFKVDDKLHDHRKARKAGPAAMGVWVLAGSWSADNLTDGFVPASIAVRWDPDGKLAARLVGVSFWFEDTHEGEDGWRFHDWDKYQPTRGNVEAKRAEWREKKRSQRVSPGDSNGDSPKDSTRDSHGESPGVSQNCPGRDGTGLGSEVQRLKTLHLSPGDSPLDASRTRRASATTSSPEFDKFWSLYPRKENKIEARKAWAKATRRADPEVIIEGARRFANDPNLPEATFIPHGSKWLNNDRWENGPLPTRLPTKAAPVDILFGAPPDTDLSLDQVKAILGQDFWNPPPPPDDLRGAARTAWQDARVAEHRADRQRQAREQIARRGA